MICAELDAGAVIRSVRGGRRLIQCHCFSFVTFQANDFVLRNQCDSGENLLLVLLSAFQQQFEIPSPSIHVCCAAAQRRSPL